MLILCATGGFATNKTDRLPKWLSDELKRTSLPAESVAVYVRESATVKLNGKTLGTAWSLPYKVQITEGVLLKENNKLEIEVTNVSANRIRYLDKKGVIWRKFYDINFVDITYNPFNAAAWKPIASGLLSEVKLVTY